ncbi:MAG: DUF1592 domain-containing protein [Planctomycetales bacterium]|nr:DUF1592 domain-containing protein [Planctomycetales bacterium]
MPSRQLLAPSLALLLFAPLAAADPGTRDQTVVPFLKSHCLDCHGDTEPEADFSIQQLLDSKSVADEFLAWEKVIKSLRSGEMPPKDEPRPDAKQAEAVAAWIESTLSEFECSQAHPGHVTIRRLNRIEYENTIRDLLGVHFDARAHFPADDTGYGFDNIGDVLSTSPLLMEKHVAAAQRISEQAILAPEMIHEPAALYKAGQLDGGASASRDARILTSSGRVGEKHAFRDSGTYVVRVTAAGDQAGTEPVRMALMIDSKPVTEFAVHAERAAPEMFLARVKIDKGQRDVAVSFLNDYYAPNDPDPNMRGDRNLLVYLLEIIGPIDAVMQNPPPSHRQLMIAQPEGDNWRDAAQAILRRFATRAFRRPASDDEINQLLALVGQTIEDGESFERGIQLAVQATLFSPSFLFRFEGEEVESAAPQPVDEFALASRLSYFLWSSMPDDELFRAAAAGQLRKDLKTHVARMLADPKSQALVDNFSGQWLETRLLDEVEPNPERFPQFDEPLRIAMRDEANHLFAHILRENRSVLELLDARYTFVNERLARHYGIEGVRGQEFRRVDLADSRRGGILTMASMLTITSHPTRTSPVKRGKWILEQVLGDPPPPPIPDAPPLDASAEAELTGTLRERLEQHRADKSCAACHHKIDPLGFALENYDAIGRWRDKDGNFDIDASGALPDGSQFNGPGDLRRLIAQRGAQFRRTLVEKMLTYALGRGLEYYDRCAVEKICRKMADDDNRFAGMILGIASSDPFQLRGGKNP